MSDEGQSRPEPGAPAPDAIGFAIAGRVTHWDPIAREVTIGDRILSVAASVVLVRDVAAGFSIMASGYQPPDPRDRWVVMKLKVD